MKKKLLILGTRGIPAQHGGFETFAERLALWLKDREWDVTVYCQGTADQTRTETWWEGIRLITLPATREGPIGTIEFDIRATRDAAKQPGLVLTLGYNTGFLNLWLKQRGRRNIINMDGLEWKRDKYDRKARTFLWLNERFAAWAGHTLIADHPRIADHLATRADRRRIVTIPYGSDEVSEADPALLAPLGLEPDKFMTVIARPEPENSIMELVTAFSAAPRGIKLAVLGKYSADVPFQKAVMDAAGPEVVFTGAIYDKPTLAALRLYSVAYCHGHRVGGTNPSLVEALGAGDPVIAHDNGFNRWVADDAALYFADAAEAARHIETILADSAVRDRMSAAARRRWREDFTWPDVLEQYRTMLESAYP